MNNRCLVKTGHPSSPSGNVTHPKQRLAVFDCRSCGKRSCYCCCSAKIRLCKQGLCCNSAARQGKTETGGTLVIPHGITGTTDTSIISDIRYHRQDIWSQGFTTPLQQTAVRAPRDETCRSHGTEASCFT